MFGSSGRLELELVRPERFSKAFSGCPDELGAVDDLRYLGLGAVATHVFFLEHLLEGHVLAYAADDVLEDVLLALRERGGSRAAEEPLPKRPALAHVDSLAPSSCFCTTRHHSNRASSSRYGTSAPPFFFLFFFSSALKTSEGGAGSLPSGLCPFVWQAL